jgi:adenosylcobyric acid synthase
MAKAIMIQGTMSNVGKSIVTAGLCRVFTEDGYRVAPFKSQNMALNSYVTRDGLEMGRAQAVQAECCRREPEAAMNPILLKPTTDMGSQVIVNGKPIGCMRARDYFTFKTQLIPQILQAYEKLDRENDIIVIEGAGSPAELNLKSNDIVNMGLAKMVNAPVILVGDINPGGIFAQLYGTVALLEENEREMIRALVVNKFRGDKDILMPGIEILEEKCGIPVAGVLPYLHLDIEEEDSQSTRFAGMYRQACVNIAVVCLPRISNYTDFLPLEACGQVSVRYVKTPEMLEDADLIILPGTKNTVSDMRWLFESGIADKVIKLHNCGVMVCGICGGYQMMGQQIVDTDNVEGGGSIRGLGIFDTQTFLETEKHTTQCVGRIRKQGFFEELADTKVFGYEIHMGRTVPNNAIPLMEDAESDCGCIAENAFGTYFHGIFENSGFTGYLLSKLCEKKKVQAPKGASLDYASYKESQYALLGDMIQKNMDMKRIYDILWKGL